MSQTATKPGEYLLDVGCGWGGLARFAAREFGVKVFGITLSKEQLKLARERVKAEGLQDKVDLHLMPPLHLLLALITADTGATIEQVQLKPLYYAAQKDALAWAGDDEDDQFFELAKLATGLSEKELDQLKRPDYVSIAQHVHEMSTRPASFFLQAPEAATPLHQPVHLLLLDAAGRTWTELLPGNARPARDQSDEKTRHQQRARRVHHRPPAPA